jgi:hypothetical protein
MICRITVSGPTVIETTERPISSQSEPTCKYILVVSTDTVAKGKTTKDTVDDNRIAKGKTTKTTKTTKDTKTPPADKNKQGVLYQKEINSKRRLKLKTLCEYLHEKLQHCKSNESYLHKSGSVTYKAQINCNYEWLISVIETEIDYHLGKRQCTKKYNEMYMREYMATQLSGFGEKFYHPNNNISFSLVAQLYKMNVKTKKC